MTIDKKISKEDIEEIMALTSMQEGMLFHYINDIDSNDYHEQLSLTLIGDVNLEMLQKSWDFLVDTNEMLRTVFRWDKLDKPVQIVLKNHKVKINYIDLSYLSESDKIAELDLIKQNEISKRIDIAIETLRIILCKVRKNRYELIISNHHILYDGWSNGIIIKEMIQAYNNICDGKKLIKVHKNRFKEFIKFNNSQNKNSQKEYWTKCLEGYECKFNFFDNKTECNSKNKYTYKLSDEITKSIKEYSKKNRVSLASIFYSTWGIILQRLSNESDIIFGTTVSGRNPDIQGINEMVGLFINTIPLRINADTDTTKQLIQKINRELEQREGYENTPLIDIYKYGSIKSDQIFFDSIVVIENYPLDRQLNSSEGDLVIDSYSIRETTNYGITLGIMPLNDIELRFSYSNGAISDESVVKLGYYFENVINSIVKDDSIKVCKIEMISEEEKQTILNKFNDTFIEYPNNKMIHEIFEEQVKKTPNAIAVLFEDNKLTYDELNKKSNSLARVLRENGVKSDSIVGIITERSLEMIIGIMAIFKAGGAYLPIDPNYPKKRIKYIIEDSKAKNIIINKKYLNGIEFDGKVLELENQNLYGMDTSNLGILSQSSNLAYVIYTSGSTGKPKGVMIEHHSIINRLIWMKKKYLFNDKDVILQKTTFTFDVSVWELLLWSFSGSKLCLLSPQGEKDVKTIIESIYENKISTVHFVPSMLNAFFEYIESEDVSEKLMSLKRVFSSGEALSIKQVEKFDKLLKKANGTNLYNLYGPTEAAVDVSYFDCLREPGLSNVPIGKPIDNIELYILDRNLMVNPIGVPGELYISGVGLARGYLNNDKLTEERFVDSPFKPGCKMYKTGDLACWMQDGNIEYLGRIDNQVKIRGFRIELGEIENELLCYNGIKEAVVVENKDENEIKHLCAYIISNKEINVRKLREFLSKNLPDYMIPSYFIQLPKLPLTLNGKVDKKALPEPNGNMVIRKKYEAPRNDVEEKLIKVWSEILEVDKIGIKDNFFELGGDSIKAIQIISRLKKYGYKLEMKELFKKPQIASLSKYVKESNAALTQESIKGEFKINPIQKWFFEQKFEEMHYWNQSVILLNKNRFDGETVRKVFHKIIEHHDTLRIVFNVNEDKITQEYKTIGNDLFYFQEIELMGGNNYFIEMEKEIEKLQVSMNITKAPLVKIGLFKMQEGDYLFISIHHLLVDGVSWRILLEDFTIGYEQALNNRCIKFQDKTSSFKEWVEGIYEYSQSNTLLNELTYWSKIEEIDKYILPMNNNKYENTARNSVKERISFTKEYTKMLLTRINNIYNTNTEDILLSALGLALKKWTKINDKFKIYLEGHGREELIDNIDITRTVGWFTSLYPFILDVKNTDDVSYYIKHVKESLRKVPNRGIGYGLLKYLTSNISVLNSDFDLSEYITFNYLGQFDKNSGEDLFEISSDFMGLSVSQKSKRAFCLEIYGMIIDGKLDIVFNYNCKQFNKPVIEDLMNFYKESLNEVIECCLQEEKKYKLIPPDVSYNGITLREFGNLMENSNFNKRENEKIYNLSPMQEGILYHSIINNGSGIYCEQQSFTVHGKIQIDLIEKSFNRIIERHDIFRSKYIYERLTRPQQIVIKELNENVYFENIGDLSNEDKNKYIESFKKDIREKGFDLSKDTLIRLSILQIEQNVYKIILCFHHIIMDGWSSGIIFEEFIKIYQSLINGRNLNLYPPYPYSNYIKWIENQPKSKAFDYWNKYLFNYKNTMVLSKFRKFSCYDEYKEAEYRIVINSNTVSKIRGILKSNGVTFSTLLNTTWSILLNKYNNTNDIVFGSIVSGRSPEIPHINDMVGLFINTIPIRIRYDENDNFSDLVKQAQNSALECDKYCHCSLADIQANHKLKQDLFDHIVVYENYPINKKIINETSKELRISDIESEGRTNYHLNVVFIPNDEELEVRYMFNSNVYGEDFICLLAKNFMNIINQVIVNPYIKIEDIEVKGNLVNSQLIYNTTIEKDFSDDKIITEDIDLFGAEFDF